MRRPAWADDTGGEAHCGSFGEAGGDRARHNAMSRTTPIDSVVAQLHADLLARCDDLFRRARDTGLPRIDVDLRWARRVYHALIDEAGHGGNSSEDADALATTIVQTLLHGIGTDSARL
ncbi:hypothetical protein ACQPXH_26665 [Nocardia sp. CA-135953]|uniref:hypothetical protein n=1 Tax=Nocardia sp. CA-135953 TaxID=3239978 RepID=UPI003D98A14E